MHPLAIVLAVTSAFTHAFRELQTKKAHDKQIFVWWFGLAALVMYFPLFVYFLHQHGLSAMGLRYVVLSGIVHCFYWYFLSRAYEDGDLSHVYPIMRSSPAIVLLFSVSLLHETVAPQAVVGVFVILAGMYLINMKGVSLEQLLEPLRSLRERPTQFALLTALAVAAYTVTDKIAMEYVHPVTFSYLITIFVMLFNTLYIFTLKQRHLVWNEWKKHPGMITVNGFITIFSYLLILIAFTFERASYVSTLRQLSVVFGVILGGHLLRERHRAMRLTASFTIFAGAALIALAP